MSRWVKTIIGLAIVVPVLAHLVYGLWTTSLTPFYFTVSELHTQRAQAQTGMLRVGGEVLAGSIGWDGTRGQLRFVLADGTQQLQVAYSGPAPETFRAGVTAIVEGRVDEEGFLAQRLFLRCPHEYVGG